MRTLHLSGSALVAALSALPALAAQQQSTCSAATAQAGAPACQAAAKVEHSSQCCVAAPTVATVSSGSCQSAVGAGQIGVRAETAGGPLTLTTTGACQQAETAAPIVLHLAGTGGAGNVMKAGTCQVQAGASCGSTAAVVSTEGSGCSAGATPSGAVAIALPQGALQIAGIACQGGEGQPAPVQGEHVIYLSERTGSGEGGHWVTAPDGALLVLGEGRQEFLPASLPAGAYTFHRAAAAQESERGYMGISIEYGEDSIGIEGVFPDSPAAMAGLKEGDRIVQIDGEAIGSVESVASQLQAKQAGEALRLRIDRDGWMRDITLTLAPVNPAWGIPAGGEEEEEGMDEFFEAAPLQLTDESAGSEDDISVFRARTDDQGLFVIEREGGEAQDGKQEHRIVVRAHPDVQGHPGAIEIHGHPGAIELEGLQIAVEGDEQGGGAWRGLVTGPDGQRKIRVHVQSEGKSEEKEIVLGGHPRVMTYNLKADDGESACSGPCCEHCKGSCCADDDHDDEAEGAEQHTFVWTVPDEAPQGLPRRLRLHGDDGAIQIEGRAIPEIAGRVRAELHKELQQSEKGDLRMLRRAEGAPAEPGAPEREELQRLRAEVRELRGLRDELREVESLRQELRRLLQRLDSDKR